MSDVNLAPVPYQTPVTASKGLLTVPWQAWFRQLSSLVITASQVDATAAAAEAEASASAASSSAASAESYSSSAETYANNAATSATESGTSASQAESSAASAAASAAAASSQGFSPYIISSPVTVPANFQMIAFQRVSLLSGGSLQINGRGRLIL